MGKTQVRKWTCLLLERMDQDAIDPGTVAEACLAYMSEADVEEMCRANDFFQDEDEDDSANGQDS
jgi:hypothetical protein